MRIGSMSKAFTALAVLQQARFDACRFEECDLAEATFEGATLKKVDLREAAELGIRSGLTSLRGATITPTQALDLAPAFAQALGLTVED